MNSKAQAHLTILQQMAESVAGPIRWVTKHRGYVDCPGSGIISCMSDRHWCMVLLDDEPRFICHCTACQPKVEEATRVLRSLCKRIEAVKISKPNPE